MKTEAKIKAEIERVRKILPKLEGGPGEDKIAPKARIAALEWVLAGDKPEKETGR